MSKKAEERALEFYPMKDYNKEPNYIHSCDSKMLDEVYREVFMLGYGQAEKDIKEWVEEQLAILDKQTLLHPDDDVFWGQRNLFKEMKDKLNSL